MSRLSELFRSRRLQLRLSPEEAARSAGYSKLQKGARHCLDLEDPACYYPDQARADRFARALDILPEDIEEARHADLVELSRPLPLTHFGVKYMAGVGVRLPLPENCSLEQAKMIVQERSRKNKGTHYLWISRLRSLAFRGGEMLESARPRVPQSVEAREGSSAGEPFEMQEEPGNEGRLRGCSNDGFFINIATREVIQIHEHARDALLDPERYGLSKEEAKAFGPRPRNFGAWRRRVLGRVMQNGWIRARGDGRGEVSLGFSAGFPADAIARAIRGFLKAYRDDFLCVKARRLYVSDPDAVQLVTEYRASIADALAETELADRLCGKGK